jgi:hypothetical protein
MSTVTFIITPDSRWPDLKSITLDNSTQVADLIKTLSRNGIKYRMAYEETKPFKYNIAPTYISR